MQGQDLLFEGKIFAKELDLQLQKILKDRAKMKEGILMKGF